MPTSISPTETEALLTSLTPLLTSPTLAFSNEHDRLRTRDALFEALRKVQSPWDIVWEQNWVNPATNASVKTLIDIGLFKRWNEVSGGRSMSSGELAGMVGEGEKGVKVDGVLLQRLLRQISGQHLVVEVAEDTFAPTSWATALASDPALSQIYGAFYHQLNAPMFLTLPDFLASKGYQNPTDVNDSNWQLCKGTSNNLFQDLALPANLPMASDFHAAMQSHSKYNLSSWTSLYPTPTIFETLKPDRPIVVDIGGSKGHDLQKFLLAHPDLPNGSLVLQDLPDVISTLPPFASPAIIAQPQDFFTPQPDTCKGAAVYFLHNVLHDWPDHLAIQILKNVAQAMERGYSRVLVHESFVSSVRPSGRVTVSDLTMMAALSAKERTEGEWGVIFGEAGLRVVRVWNGGGGAGEGEGVIEGCLV